MKLTWLSSESSLISAYIFEGIFGYLKCNKRYLLHQIQQNKHDRTEYQIAFSEWVLFFIFNQVYTLHLLNRKFICPSKTAVIIFLVCIMCQYLNFDLVAHCKMHIRKATLI